MLTLKGVYTAMVTPFDKDGRIDHAGLSANIEYQLNNAVDGLVVLGTTGEAPTLTREEKRELITQTVREIRGKVPVIIGTGSYSTAATVEATREAQDLGADAALVVTPYYNKPTQEGIFRHFNAVAQSVGIPIIVYNILGRTGQNIQTETLKRLADIPNIIGVKESSGSVAQMMEVMEAIGNYKNSFSLLSGEDNLTLPGISIGARGIISVVGNLVPGTIKMLVDSALNGNFEKAREVHYQLMPLFKGAFIETNPIPIKAAMNLCGLAAGGCRLPLCELTSDNEIKIQQLVKELRPLIDHNKLVHAI